MAKATAVCTCAQCGATFYKTVTRSNRSQANAWEEWAAEVFTQCDDCYHTEKEEKYRKASEEARKDAEELQLPELTGSEKQVLWALALRKAFCDKVDMLITEYQDDAKKAKDDCNIQLMKDILADIDTISLIYQWILKTQTASRVWIDVRFKDAMSIIERFAEEALKVRNSINNNIPEEDQIAAIEEMTVEPAGLQHSGVVEIVIEKNQISAKTTKNDDFREIVKTLGYRWDTDNRVWSRVITRYNGDVIDRAAELGSKLLNNGFAIRCSDQHVLEMAVAGEYKEECTRWILATKDAKNLVIKFPRDSNLNHKVKRIGALWNSSNQGYLIAIDNYREVLDFASLNGFSVSDDVYRQVEVIKANTLTVHPVAHQVENIPSEQERLQAQLQTSSAIIPDLLDD